jgi:hypothetical protein
MCPGCLSPPNGDPVSTQILTRHFGAHSQTVSQLVNSWTTPTSKSPQFNETPNTTRNMTFYGIAIYDDVKFVIK